jgi:Ca2+-binding EF-hand superfamily protein
MFKRTNIVLMLAVFVAVLATMGATAPQKDSAPKIANKQVIAQSEVKQLLLLMDADKNGKISKQEWMDYMSKEFDALDTDKSGELDVKELALSSIRVSHPVYQGK